MPESKPKPFVVGEPRAAIDIRTLASALINYALAKLR
jgi:hypothetical protein